MKKLFNNMSGYYLPAFLFIQLNDSIDFENFESNPDEVKGTFMHEYCHFLQDVSTTAVYLNFLHYIQDFLYKVGDKSRFDGKDILQYNRDFHNLYYGDESIEDDIFLISKIEYREDEICAELYPDSNVKKVMVRYNQNKEFQFGSCCVSESMAYLVEKRLYNVRKRENEFPYNACEEICKCVYPEIAQNEIWVMALCELALLELDSGMFFVKSLEKMKEKKFIPETLKDIETFIDQHYEIGFRGKGDVIELLLSEIYPSCSIDFSPLKKWIIGRFNLGCKFRESSKCFISRALCSDDISDRFSNWNPLMRKFGCPVVIDADGNYREGAYLDEKSIEIGYMLAPMAINEMLDYNGFCIKSACPLVELCYAANDPLYSDRCKIDLRMDMDSELLCAVRGFWRMYKLQ